MEKPAVAASIGEQDASVLVQAITRNMDGLLMARVPAARSKMSAIQQHVDMEIVDAAFAGAGAKHLR